MRRKGYACLAFLMAILLFLPTVHAEEEEEDVSIETIIEEVMLDDDNNAIPMDEYMASEEASTEETSEDSTEETTVDQTARNDFIDRIINLGYELYVKADGKSQRAHYASDIYVCKNFTVYLFRQNRDDFRIAEYPDVTLVIPNNLSKAECEPYSYGLAWEDIPASEGNPFYEAASFRYDTSLTYDENFQLACDFMRQAQRGDYFQMSAKYEYGTGAHSAIMLGYDEENDEIHWMDSNMRGGKKNGIRYGLVQYDAVKSVEWWAEAFCKKTRGATLYRLRDDIIYAE